MELLPGKRAAERVEGVLNAKYQVHGYWVDLTIRSISGVDSTGRLDFGGGEYVPAGRVRITPHPQRSADTYQWWDLPRGCYLIEFNETLDLAENEIALLEPDPRLLRTGASHSPIFLRGRVDPIDTLLEVQAQRLEVKQNARASRVRIFQLGNVSEARPLLRKPPAKRAQALRKRAGG
jgi:deoxycytidine triphosphate deaminase